MIGASAEELSAVVQWYWWCSNPVYRIGAVLMVCSSLEFVMIKLQTE